MKLCPQCEFIYEDSQALCDMDGQELVFESKPSIASEKSPADPVSQLGRSGWRGMPLRIVAGVVLVAGLLLMYKVFTPEVDVAKVNALSVRNGSSATSTLPAAVAIPEKQVLPAATPDLPTAVSEAAHEAAQSVPDSSPTPARDSKSPNNHAAGAKAPLSFSVYSLPRVKPLPTLKPIPKLSDREPSRMSPSQKPVVENKKKQSKVSSFFKKTAQVITRPFKS